MFPAWAPHVGASGPRRCRVRRQPPGLPHGTRNAAACVPAWLTCAHRGLLPGPLLPQHQVVLHGVGAQAVEAKPVDHRPAQDHQSSTRARAAEGGDTLTCGGVFSWPSTRRRSRSLGVFEPEDARLGVAWLGPGRHAACKQTAARDRHAEPGVTRPPVRAPLLWRQLAGTLHGHAPISTKPKPRPMLASMISACLSKPAARPAGGGHGRRAAHACRQMRCAPPWHRSPASCRLPTALGGACVPTTRADARTDRVGEFPVPDGAAQDGRVRPGLLGHEPPLCREDAQRVARLGVEQAHQGPQAAHHVELRRHIGVLVPGERAATRQPGGDGRVLRASRADLRNAFEMPSLPPPRAAKSSVGERVPTTASHAPSGT